jgi:hypothetical protein
MKKRLAKTRHQVCSARQQNKSWLYSVEKQQTELPNKSCGKLEHQNMLTRGSMYLFLVVSQLLLAELIFTDASKVGARE